MKTLTKIEKKAMCIVLSAGYASGKTPSSVLNIFDEHCKDHVKAELTATKKRIIELGGQVVEETWTDPLYNENHDE